MHTQQLQRTPWYWCRSKRYNFELWVLPMTFLTYLVEARPVLLCFAKPEIMNKFNEKDLNPFLHPIHRYISLNQIQCQKIYILLCKRVVFKEGMLDPKILPSPSNSNQSDIRFSNKDFMILYYKEMRSDILSKFSMLNFHCLEHY